jgi:tRNA modification GTPase
MVSPQRGTTRDYLTATIEIDGARCELVDTAGIDEDFLSFSRDSRSGAARNAQDGRMPRDATTRQCAIVESSCESNIDFAAQSLAAERRAEASICLHCLDATDAMAFARLSPSMLQNSKHGDIVVLTKSDLTETKPQSSTKPEHIAIVATSSRTGAGLDDLCAHIRRLLETAVVAQHGQVVAATAERCGESVRLAESAIARASEVIHHGAGDELAAAELHVALSELGKVVGAVYTDDMLDRIFSTFCIGK